MPVRPRQRLRGSAVLAAGSVFLAMALLAVLLVLLNKAGGIADLVSLPRLRLVGLAWLVVALLDAGLLATAYYQSAADRRRGFWQPLARALGLSVLAILGAEVGLRALATPTPLGLRVGQLDLLPFDWRRARETSEQWLRRTREPSSVFDVEDAGLGWDLGRGRQSADGQYVTGTGGFRIADRASEAVPSAARFRVALIGDSFTFGEEVAFAESWGEQLEQQLAPGTMVLNYGVPSHGPDQTLLKYGRDVRSVDAQVTIFSFLSASALRNLSIYQFLRPYLALPFSKPRFVLLNDVMVPLNSPPVSAERILGAPSVWSLDHLGKDASFRVGQWSAPLGSEFYLTRYLTSRFPRFRRPEEHIDETAVIALGARIIEQLVAEIRAAGSVPVIVALPVRADLTGGPVGLRDGVIAALAERGIVVLELGPCILRQTSIREAFVAESSRDPTNADPGPAHYSPEGNAAVAKCLAPPVRAILATVDSQ